MAKISKIDKKSEYAIYFWFLLSVIIISGFNFFYSYRENIVENNVPIPISDIKITELFYRKRSSSMTIIYNNEKYFVSANLPRYKKDKIKPEDLHYYYDPYLNEVFVKEEYFNDYNYRNKLFVIVPLILFQWSLRVFVNKHIRPLFRDKKHKETNENA